MPPAVIKAKPLSVILRREFISKYQITTAKGKAYPSIARKTQRRERGRVFVINNQFTECHGK
jgi:hypothetical protein